jgi:hypothetical protein
MQQAAVVPTHPIEPGSAPRRMASRPLARVLFVAGAVGLIGVTVDLLSGPPASAVPTPTSYISYQTILDSSVANNLLDVTLEPGASVAAYGTSGSDTSAQATAPSVSVSSEDKPLEQGASVGAYGS